MTITVSTDGSALGNPNGPMGWAWADHDKNAGGSPGHEHDEHGYDAGGATNGTNQIGELCAVLEALRAHPGEEPLLIESDSQYAINCSTTWVKGWKRNGWKNSQKKPVKNVELIKAIDAEISKRPGPVSFKWVKGHAGDEGNELVDELARTYAGDCRSGARDGYLPIEGWQSLLHSEYAHGTDVPPDVQLVLDGRADASALRKPEPSKTHPQSHESRTGMGKTSGQSLVDMLAEPEGVPDFDFDEHADDSHDAQHAEDHSLDSVAQPDTDVRPSAQSAQPRPSTVQSGQHSATPSGLTVSGTLAFSPAPKTSPYFNGQPLPISGTIAIEGYVDGDGKLTITNAPFFRQ
ncbi:ribonuclease HI [Bifidobacterium reuteri]|uniref:ribonuclease H n=1 Tax=Bifidobacterium reuteri TaxID=983706 RepID=A0A5J5EAT3_9BIFI|nr:RNase H family protein [Bifidobacterium reuteri]KAA8826678.1 ribonuclease HI [Bifidobacterium reuteri]